MIPMTAGMKSIYPGVDFSLTSAVKKLDPELIRLEPRRGNIIKILTEQGGMTSGQLCGKIRTSKNTARKDLIYLFNNGSIMRRDEGKGGRMKKVYFIPSH